MVASLISCKGNKKAQRGDSMLYTDSVTIIPRPDYVGSDTLKWDLIHTSLVFEPAFDERALNGNAILTLTPYAYPQRELVLDAVGFEIPSIDIGDKRINTYTYRDSMHLRITLDKVYLPGDTLKIEISYYAQPYTLVKRELTNGYENQGMYFLNHNGEIPGQPTQMYTQGETRHNSCWFPTIDAPNQKHTQDISITVPDSLTTISNGELVYSSRNGGNRRTDKWELNSPHSVYLTMIGAGKWKKFKQKWRDSVEVTHYIEAPLLPYAQLTYGVTLEAMEFYSNLTGVPYPWPNFKQVAVRDFVSGAMENTTAVLHSNFVAHDSRAHLDETYEDYIVHELFHHWFGDLVTCEGWAHVTLNEGFATLGEFLWKEYKYGENAGIEARADDMAKYFNEYRNTKQEPIINTQFIAEERLFDSHRYAKGGLVLSMLRDMLTPKVFGEGMRIYLTKHAYKNAEIDDLRQAMELASGFDLTPFFNQWFMSEGHPMIEVAHRWNPNLNRMIVKVVQKQKKLFKFDLPFQLIDENGKAYKSSIPVYKRSDTFILENNRKALTIIYNPESRLVAQINVRKPEQELYDQWKYKVNPLSGNQAIFALMPEREDIKPGMPLQLENKLLLDTTPLVLMSEINIYRYLVTGDEKDPIAEEKFVREVLPPYYKHKNAHVRNLAFAHTRFLAQKEPIGNIIKLAMADSSYQVVTNGIYLASINLRNSHIDDTTFRSLIAPARAFVRSEDVSLALFYAYSYQGYPSDNAYLQQLLWRSDARARRTMLEEYATFLSRFPELINSSIKFNESLPILFEGNGKDVLIAYLYNVYNGTNDGTPIKESARKMLLDLGKDVTKSD